MLWGPPRVGKTSIVEQLVTNLGYGLFEWRLGSMTVLDMVGQPFVDKERHLTDWGRTPLVPPPDSSMPSVLFVDEITTAVPAIQAQAYQVFRERRVGHASITTTLNTHGHLMPSAFQGVGARLDALFQGNNKATKQDAGSATSPNPVSVLVGPGGLEPPTS